MFNPNWDPYQELIDCQGHLNNLQANMIELAMGMNNHSQAINDIANNQKMLEQQLRLLRAELASYRLELQQSQALLTRN